MCSIAAMTAYIRYTLLVYIAFQRIDEKHDSKLGERRCSFTLKESLLRVRCVCWEPGSFNKLNFIGLLLVGYFALCGSSPRQEDFPHGGGEENFLMSPSPQCVVKEILGQYGQGKRCDHGPGRCLLIVLLVSFGQGFHHGAQHLDRPLRETAGVSGSGLLVSGGIDGLLSSITITSPSSGIVTEQGSQGNTEQGED